MESSGRKAAALPGLATWFSLADNQPVNRVPVVWPEIVKVLKLPHVWLLALLIFCSYAPMVSFLFIAPFTTVAYRGSVVFGASLSIATQYNYPTCI
jgi:hypothetical protein